MTRTHNLHIFGAIPFVKLQKPTPEQVKRLKTLVIPHSGHDFWGKFWGNRGSILEVHIFGVISFVKLQKRQLNRLTVKNARTCPGTSSGTSGTIWG